MSPRNMLDEAELRNDSAKNACADKGIADHVSTGVKAVVAEERAN